VDPYWGVYKRRLHALLMSPIWAFLWMWPGSLIQSILVGFGLNGDLAFFLVVVFPALGTIVVAYLRWIFWPCPKCGRPFQFSWAAYWFTHRCVHCGLPKWGCSGKMKSTFPTLDEF
jgi:hypothetical protein